MMDAALSNFKKFTPKTLPKFEALAQGHRACQGCGEVLALRMALKAMGKNIIVASATGCMEIVTSPYPQTAWDVPWIHVAFENAAAVASGIEAGRKALMRKGRLPKQKTTIVAMAGDGGTADIGLQALSGALERRHDFVYICLDNEAYMNTGVQRSSATPFGAMTTTSPPGKLSMGQYTWKKNMPAIAAAHDIPYVATATPAFYTDLMNKAKKAAQIEGPAYLHLFASCPTGWRLAPEKAVEIGRLAVQTRVFPLYEVINGQVILNRKVKKPKPVEEYLKLQGRFRHLDKKSIQYIQDRVNREYEALAQKAAMAEEKEATTDEAED